MKKTLIASLLAAAALVPVASHASDGTITFTGQVVAQTCAVSNSGTVAVALPRVSTTALATAGATTGTTAFNINLTGCAAGSVRSFFEAGPNVDTGTGRLKNTATSGATNVQVGLVNSDNTAITIGASSGSQGTSYVTIPANGALALSYAARYVATGLATSGAVNTSVTYSLEFL